MPGLIQRAINEANRRLDDYKEFSEKYPDAKLAADLAPVTGAVTSIGDSALAAREGRYGDAALELLGVVPGVKAAVKAKSAIKAIRNITHGVDATSDSVTYGESQYARVRAVDPDKVRENIKRLFAEKSEE